LSQKRVNPPLVQGAQHFEHVKIEKVLCECNILPFCHETTEPDAIKQCSQLFEALTQRGSGLILATVAP